MTAFQPYFVAYATAHGMTPEVMAARTDRCRNVDFMCWIGARWAAFRAVRPELFTRDAHGSEYRKLPGAHEAFGAWLCAGGAA